DYEETFEPSGVGEFTKCVSCAVQAIRACSERVCVHVSGDVQLFLRDREHPTELGCRPAAVGLGVNAPYLGAPRSKKCEKAKVVIVSAIADIHSWSIEAEHFGNHFVIAGPK